MISRVVNNIFKMMTERKAPPMLGRWSLKRCEVLEDRHVFYANRDHCGDIICGTPIIYSNK